MPGATVEGATRLAATPRDALAKGPGTRVKGEPFYNPAMALNRDLSVLLVEAEARRRGRDLDVADALAGTGARAVRIAREADAPLTVHANDAEPRAVAALRNAVAENGVEGRVRVHEGDAHAFLASRRFDIVDLDPCGSPMPFLDAALRAAREGGLLCATATDTGALCGTFPRVARRRYGAHHGLHPFRWNAEVGLRILGGAVVAAAARAERAATPILSVAHGHWMRVVCRIEDGSRRADEALARLRNAVPDAADVGGRLVPTSAPHEGRWAGPLWGGPLHDAGVVAGLAAALPGKSLARPREVEALLPLLQGEAHPSTPAFWVVPDLLATRLGTPPRRDRLIAALRDAGWRAERTHLDAQGVRTDADLAALSLVWAPTAKP